jgi:hypothetical protein
MTTTFVENPEIVSLQKLYCPVCGELIYAPFMKAEPPPCEHVLFLFMSNPFEFIYTAPACKDIVDKAMEACDQSTYWSDEEMQLPEEVRNAMPPKEFVDPVVFALEQLRVGKPGSSILGFRINVEVPMDSETVGVAIDFDPDGSWKSALDVQVP